MLAKRGFYEYDCVTKEDFIFMKQNILLSIDVHLVGQYYLVAFH